MRDRLLILAGTILFLVLLSYPVWQGLAARTVTSGPELRQAAGQKSCVAPRQQMREAHMELLMQWRDNKVRSGERSFTAADGTIYAVNLTRTCLTQCHGSKDKFCDSCHAYAGVPTPDCWGCHTSPTPLPSAASTGGGR